MGDHSQQQKLYKIITNLSNSKHQSSENQQLLPNDRDQLTIILNGETILPHPSLTFTNINNMTTNITVGDGVVQTVPNETPPPR